MHNYFGFKLFLHLFHAAIIIDKEFNVKSLSDVL